jgi:hypothetical protein
MFKIIALLKKKPGLSVEEFKAYYEQRHAPHGLPYLRGNCVRYIRRYFQPLTNNPLPGDGKTCEYDGIMELWFKDRAQWEATMKLLSEPSVMQSIVEDERQLFDRDAIRMFVVDECESDVT